MITFYISADLAVSEVVMFNEKMYELGSKRSVIRELFELGKKRAAEFGADKVFDFSLGNPNVPAPAAVNETIKNILDEMPSTVIHGYTSAQGDAGTRKAVADYINERFGCSVNADNIYMTCGAAASLTISLKALCSKDTDEVVIFAPYFPEYTVFIANANARYVSVPALPVTFQPDLASFESSINADTRAVIINSPNNPSGVVYTEETVKAICSILGAKSKEFGNPIYIICDEPYRELVYDSVNVPYLMNYYDDVLVCYSYSKSLSLPGERIGYIAVSPKAKDSASIYAAVCGAGRSLGYVCAPSLMQEVVKRCLKEKPDIESYKANRDLLYNSLSEYGYDCVKPDGAFYLFVKILGDDEEEFCRRASDRGLLLVPGAGFASPGYVRIAYCVSTDTIRRSLPEFEALAKSYR